MRGRVLRGREHTILGGYAAFAEGRSAVAVSMGGAPKRYPHHDPNEDVSAFAQGEGGVLLVAADGHGGHQAAEIAVDELLKRMGTHWTGANVPDFNSTWSRDVRDLSWGLHTAILEASPSGATHPSRTTLTAALVRPGDEFLAYFSVGDSHLFHVGDSDVVDLACAAEERPCFLGNAALTRAELDHNCVVGFENLRGTRAVLVATDGFSEVGIGFDQPEAEVAAIHAQSLDVPREQRALAIVRGLIDQALSTHRDRNAGDNVACGVTWLGEDFEPEGGDIPGSAQNPSPNARE
ncbi:protein phosphatase 2C domain-containing protein [Myxococcota bacterium]|nr:protein phosphatase 2C domain-containing protein [Myxococcota bacterium]